MTGEQRCVTRELLPQPWAALKTSIPNATLTFHVHRFDGALGNASTNASSAPLGHPATVDAVHGAPGTVPASQGAGLDRPTDVGGLAEGTSPPAVQPAADSEGALRAPAVSQWALVAGPVLSAFVALAAIPILAWLLYHRLRREEVFGHPRRAAIVEVVRQRPGLSEREVAAALEMPHSLVDYHARHLANHGALRIRRVAGGKYLFPAGEERAKDHLAPLIRRGRTRCVLEAICEEPGMTLSALAARVGMSVSSAHWHVGRLQAEGLVASVREGREVRLRLSDGGKAAAMMLLAKP